MQNKWDNFKKLKDYKELENQAIENLFDYEVEEDMN